MIRGVKKSSKRAVVRPPKRTPSGGYARGDETRLRIVETALDIFGQSGFENASTRAIAQRAGVNLGALTYYFGSKEGLYRACAEHIASFVEKGSRPILAGIENALQNTALSQADLLTILRTYVDLTTENLVGDNEPQNWLLFMSREQTNPAVASDVIYKRVTRQLIDALAGLVGRITNRPAEQPETIIRALAIIGQLIVFRRMRSGTLRALDWPDFQGDRGALLKQVLWHQIESALVGPIPPG